MTARPAAIALAALLAAGARAEDAVAAPPEGPGPPALRTALLGEATLSAAHAERGDLAMGGRLTLRLGPVAATGSLDFAAEATEVQPRLSALLLVGPALVRDLSPRLGAHAGLLVGLEWLGVRDYVAGGWRDFVEPAAGARAGLEWRFRGAVGPRFHSGWLGQLGLAPVVGVSGTVIYAGTGSDRLRGIEWGGVAALLSLTLGAEVASPPRDASPPEAAGAEPVALAPGPAPAPAAPPEPRRPWLDAQLVVGGGAGEGATFSGGGRLSWAPSRRSVVSASWDAGEGESREVHEVAAAGAGVRALRRGFVLEALALAGLHRVRERDDVTGWHARALPAAGVRVGISRAPRRAGVSLVYGLSGSVLASRPAASRVGRDDVGGVLGVAAASIGLAL